MKNYEKPQVERIVFSSTDEITTTGGILSGGMGVIPNPWAPQAVKRDDEK